MMARARRLLGRRPPPIIKVPVLTPRLSSYWVALVTPVETGLVQPLVDGLEPRCSSSSRRRRASTTSPLGFDDAVRAALP